MNQPGFVRAIVAKKGSQTKVEWAHDSAWRFMPPVKRDGAGFQLHPIDLAINKVLALAGREEPRDFIDILYINNEILPLGALVWAAVGKDPGFTPLSLLELLKRRGRYHSEDFARLALRDPVDLHKMKTEWLAALQEAEDFIRSRPPEELGCLYYSSEKKRFVAPQSKEAVGVNYSLHFGRPGGVLPNMFMGDALTELF